MIVHIALFRWKDGTEIEAISKAMQDVRDLRDKVDGVVDILCGKNFSKWHKGFTHAVVVLAKDVGSLEAYRKHPDHEDVAGRIDKMEADSIGIDFES